MVSYENLPEVLYLGIYQPLTGECEDFDFTWYSSKIEEPLDRFGEDAVERWFSEEQVDELIEFTEQFAA
jgi:hypothetical protein